MKRERDLTASTNLNESREGDNNIPEMTKQRLAERYCQTDCDDNDYHIITKKPRTDQYLYELSNFEKTQETVDFFQRELTRLSTNSALQNEKILSGSESSPESSHPKLLQLNLNRRWERHQQNFQIIRRRLVISAKERLHFERSVGIVRQKVMGESTYSETEAKSPLQQLHLGLETTESILGIIEEYAGRPSKSEVVDCQHLIALAGGDSRR